MRKALPLVILLFVAAAAAWFLLRPVHRRNIRPPIAVAPSPVAPATVLPSATPSPRATPHPRTAEPAPSPSAPLPSAPPRIGNPNAPKLALIIDDCGQWVTTERAFIALPFPLTLAVLPDVHATRMIATEAAAAGKGVMLHLPMETISGLNPGPGKVTTEMTNAQIAAQVQADLAQVPLASGVNNHEGSKATADRRVMTDVVKVLKAHGNLFFIDSRTTAASVAERVAAAQGVPTASRDVFLDDEQSIPYIEAQLRSAADIAKHTGSAIAIGHPRPTTLAAVRALALELQRDGIEFVLARQLTH